jgi:hypothetical protein
MKRLVVILVLSLPLWVSGCGDHLGEYRTEDVRLVPAIPPAAVNGMTNSPYPEFVRIELSSPTNLYDAKTGPGLYADADFCPLRNPNRMIVFGPVANDEDAVERWKRKKALTPDSRDKRYHYFVYVVPRSPPRKLFSNSKDTITGYDLRNQPRDICLCFHVPGYNIVPSRSDTVKIHAETLSAAFNPS